MNKFSIKTPSHPRGDAYSLHRTALRPLLPYASERDLFESCTQIKQIGKPRFIEFLHQQNLAPMWGKALRSTSNTTLVSDNFIETLHQSRLLATGAYMLQSQGLKKIKSTFESENINHVIFKGCHIRESIYDEPAIRPAGDIDVLISPDDKIKAIQTLVNVGYQFVPDQENISHQATLNKGEISIDLHWDILRPGRTRIPMTATLIKTRKELPTHWGFNSDATLFLMLVHPVFNKYSTGPRSSLIRIVDLAHWIETKNPDWEQIDSWLGDAGVRTAAWITFEWLRQLTQITPPTSFIERLQPRKLRTEYLRYWITKNLSSRFINSPFLIKTAFTLPAHDNLSDAIHAITTLQKVKKLAPRQMNELNTAYEETLHMMADK